MDKYLKEKREIFKYLPKNTDVINFNENIHETMKNNIVGYELWTYFLLLVIILLFIEMILSNLIIKNE